MWHLDSWIIMKGDTLGFFTKFYGQEAWSLMGSPTQQIRHSALHHYKLKMQCIKRVFC